MYEMREMYQYSFEYVDQFGSTFLIYFKAYDDADASDRMERMKNPTTGWQKIVATIPAHSDTFEDQNAGSSAKIH